MEDLDVTTGSQGQRIDLTKDVEVAYWCRLFDIDHSQLRRAVQQVGPRADAVFRHLTRSQVAERTAATNGHAWSGRAADERPS
ncbi:MAG TPA: DUF3606 domain-containing protein [Albitalea sp.]|nr:DUF3606 domain-containing protein [Albitalea sp.]